MSQRVAVVHDWLTGMRGGEKVLEAILELFPQADLFTLFHHPGTVSPTIENRRIVTSSLQRWSTRVGDYRRLLPFFTHAVEQFRFEGYDLVISSSHAVVKGVKVPAGVPHLCYCHTPMRYIWDRFDDYFPPTRPLLRTAARLLAPYLRRWDVATASRVTQYVANSRFVADRIQRIYGREARVIYPFVDESFLQQPMAAERGDYDLIISALVPYKRVDLAIDAAKLGRRKLRIVGGGPMLDRVRRSGAGWVDVSGWVDPDTLRRLVARARCLILPGVEDFGITPLEAMAVGTPVVAYRDGGALESVSEGETGIFFDRPEPRTLLAALEQVERRSWDRDVLRARAAGFRKERFLREFSDAAAQIGSTRR